MRNTEILWSFPSLEPYLIIEPLSARGNVPNFPAEWSLVASSDYRSCVHRPISSNERSGGGRVGEGEAYVHWYQPQDNFTRGGQRYQMGE